jgi:hypothetical protein
MEIIAEPSEGVSGIEYLETTSPEIAFLTSRVIPSARRLKMYD